jgi:hypothetical protein
MKFIAVGTDVRPEAFGPYLPEERAVLAQLRQEGVVTAVYRQVPEGVIFSVMEATNRPAAIAHMARLPLVREGLLSFELFEVTAL